MAASTERIAAANTFYREPASKDRAMGLNGIKGVLGATGGEATTTERSKENSFRGRKRPAINADEENQNMLPGVHHDFDNCIWRSALRKSCSTWANDFSTIEFLATKTRSTGCAISCWCKRNDSRNNLRARLRTTALPIFRLVMTPNRVGEPAGRISQFAIKQPEESRCPFDFARRKSRPNFNLLERGKRNEREGPAPMPKFKPESNACDPHGDGWPKWLCRSWWNCDLGNRAAVCGESSMVDIGVSSFLN